MPNPDNDDPNPDTRPPHGVPRRRPLRIGDRETLERLRELDEFSPGEVID